MLRPRAGDSHDSLANMAPPEVLLTASTLQTIACLHWLRSLRIRAKVLLATSVQVRTCTGRIWSFVNLLTV